MKDGGKDYLAQEIRKADQQRAEEPKYDTFLGIAALHPSEKVAVDRTCTTAKLRSIAAQQDLLKKCEVLVPGFNANHLSLVTAFIRDRCEVMINFAPFGRPWADDWGKEWDGKLQSGEMRSLLQLLTEDDAGTYKNQFETGTSGGLNDQNERRDVERRLFGDAYDVDHSAFSAASSSSSSSSSSSRSSRSRSKASTGATNAEIDMRRPKYGALNVLSHHKGDYNAGNYGMSSFMLKSNNNLRERCTITSCDSINNTDAQLGTLAHCNHVLLDQINRIERDKGQDAAVDYVESLMQISGAVQRKTNEKTQKGKQKKGKKKGGKTSDDEEVESDRKAAFEYIEVQLHGEIDIARDFMRVTTHLDDVKRGRELDLHDWWGKFRERFGIAVSYMDGDRRVNL